MLDSRSEGSPPSVSVYDEDGQPLPDGSYTYELRAEMLLNQSAVERSPYETADGREFSLRPDVLPRALPAVFGVFTIASGSIVAPQPGEPQLSSPRATRGPDSAATGATLNAVYTEDLIVQGSECVGVDCANTESFGFDTIRLKENNLRINFEDTSNSGSFPSTDWRLTANDSTNGGANRFSIEDATAGRIPFTIRGNAPNNSLFVDASGRLGLKTATPAVEIHSVDGDTPTLRLEQDGSSGFTPQTWDVAGNETNFFVRDVTGASRLPFRIKPGAPDNSVFIATNGDVGFGTASPTTNVHVKANGTSGADANSEILLDSGGTAKWKWRSNGTNGQMNVIDDVNSLVPLRIAMGSSHNLVQLGINGSNRVDITGQLFINGVNNSTPDYVFAPGYPLETIEEHADFMWNSRHLPALVPAQMAQDGKAAFDLGARSQGVLEELEKAHIYIDQLNSRVKALSLAISERDATLAEIRAEIEALKRRVHR